MATRLPLTGDASPAAPTHAAPLAQSTLLAGGFRPFFLLAGLYAAASLAAWLLTYGGWWSLPAPWVPMWWHGHELVFGFAGAAICGFLLTAVPKWTGTPMVRGLPLAGLVLLWLLGRAAMWAAGVLPPAAVAVVDLLLFPAMAWAIGRPIARTGNRRNYGFPALLLVLFVANLLTHLGVLGEATTARPALYLSVYVVVIMVAVVAGRIIPNFTANALLRQGVEAEVHPGRGVGQAAVAMVVVASALQVLGVGRVIEGVAAGAAAVLLLARSIRWQSLRTWRDPLVWILHVGHAWLIVGFAAIAAADLGVGLPGTTAMHALTAGAIGTMVIAVMSRASLGHSGRPLQASGALTAAYVLVVAGAVVRVFAPLVGALPYRTVILVGGTLWAAGYLVFTVAFLPVLTRPRVDGKPG